MIQPSSPRRISVSLLLTAGILSGCLAWACWPVLGYMATKWTHDPRYSHGYLVPLFAVALLWLRRSQIKGIALRPSAWGLVMIGVGAALHLAGGYIRSDWLDGLALLPYLAGFFLLLGGWPALSWAWPAVGFLVFMVPLPWSLEVALGASLQRVAAISSTFLLQTFGYEAFAEGNVIAIGDARVNVAEACSGLSMLMTFFALTTAVAVLVKRPLHERVLLVLSAIPIALMANIARIVLTGILYVTASSKTAEHFFHDFAGWLMIVFALFLLWLEAKLFALSIVTEEFEEQHVGTVLGRAVYSPAATAPSATSDGATGRFSS